MIAAKQTFVSAAGVMDQPASAMVNVVIDQDNPTGEAIVLKIDRS